MNALMRVRVQFAANRAMRHGTISATGRETVRRFLRSGTDEQQSQLCDFIADEAVVAGAVRSEDVPAAGASERDWSGFFERLIAFIEQLMPMILMFIEMFSKFA